MPLSEVTPFTNNILMIDLHTHSTASDGSDTPELLAAQGKAAGLSLMALTDHDNTDGTAAFLEACRAEGLCGIAGIELSAEVDEGSLHILGLGIDPGNAQLQENLTRVIEGREWRNAQMLERLNELGLELTWCEIADLAGADLISRAHFALALINRGYVSTISEAFELYLGKGAPAYVDRFRFYPEECIRMIHEAGGIAVAAHPFSWSQDRALLIENLAALKEQGIDGMEVYYTAYSLEERVDLLRIATKLNLLPFAGSDYHGDAKADIPLGAPQPPPETEAAIRQALSRCPGAVWL